MTHDLMRDGTRRTTAHTTSCRTNALVAVAERVAYDASHDA